MAETKKQMQERYEKLLEHERNVYADLLGKYSNLQDSGDELFRQTAEYKQMSADLLAYKEANAALEKKLKREKEIKAKLQDRLAEAERKYQELISDTKNKHEELKELQEKTKHNARGAGRKPSEKRLEAIQKVKSLLDAGIDDEEIMQQLNISRATFFRYKRSIKN